MAAGASTFLTPILHPDDPGNAAWVPVHLLAFATLIAVLLALVGIFVRQLPRSGRLGLAGFLAAFFGTSMMLMEGREHLFSHDFGQGTPGGLWQLITTSLVFSVGYVLLGVAIFRAGVLPRAAGVLCSPPAARSWRSCRPPSGSWRSSSSATPCSVPASPSQGTRCSSRPRARPGKTSEREPPLTLRYGRSPTKRANDAREGCSLLLGGWRAGGDRPDDRRGAVLARGRRPGPRRATPPADEGYLGVFCGVRWVAGARLPAAHI